MACQSNIVWWLQRRRVGAKQVRHHHGDAALGGLHVQGLGPKSELVTQRGLDARAIEDFPLDLGGLHGLIADELDPEGFLIVRPDMLESADELPGLHQKLPFQGRQNLGIIGRNLGQSGCCQFHGMSYRTPFYSS